MKTFICCGYNYNVATAVRDGPVRSVVRISRSGFWVRSGQLWLLFFHKVIFSRRMSILVSDLPSRSSEFLFSMTIEIRLSDGISEIVNELCHMSHVHQSCDMVQKRTDNDTFFGDCREIRIFWCWKIAHVTFWVANSITSYKCSLFSFSRN